VAASKGRCPLCGDPDLTNAGQVRAGIVVRCSRCGLGWVDKPAELPTEEVYGEEFFDVFDDEAYVAQRDQTLELHLDTIADLRPAGRDLLDVGAAVGDFVAIAETHGWTALGVEPARSAADRARKLGRPVVHGDLDHPDIRDRRFDAIHLSHVVEHLPDPFAGLRQCAGLLAPSGVLAIEVPNEFDNLFRQARRITRRMGDADKLTDEHLWFFNRPTIARAVVESGLRPELVRTRNWTPLTSHLPLGGAVKRAVDVASRRAGRGEVIEVYARKVA
jgi:SAM-dependent methyltransferase